MKDRICKGLKVQVEWANLSVSTTGTVVGVDPQTFVIALAPDDEQSAPTPPLGQTSEVRVSVAADDALYRFVSTLLQSFGFLLYLSFPQEIRRIQRRDDVRQPCLFDVEVILRAGDRAPKTRERATAVNISCGGLLMVFEGCLQVDDTLELSMRLHDSGPPLYMTARVVRSEPFSHLGRHLNRVALRMVSVNRADERRLAQFIIKCQVKARTATPTAVP